MCFARAGQLRRGARRPPPRRSRRPRRLGPHRAAARGRRPGPVALAPSGAFDELLDRDQRVVELAAAEGERMCPTATDGDRPDAAWCCTRMRTRAPPTRSSCCAGSRRPHNRSAAGAMRWRRSRARWFPRTRRAAARAAAPRAPGRARRSTACAWSSPHVVPLGDWDRLDPLLARARELAGPPARRRRSGGSPTGRRACSSPRRRDADALELALPACAALEAHGEAYTGAPAVRDLVARLGDPPRRLRPRARRPGSRRWVRARAPRRSARGWRPPGADYLCAPVFALRSAFPILERIAYLNAGTDGPVPRAAQEAVAREVAAEVEEGPRAGALRAPLRAHRAAPRRLRRVTRCPVDDLALCTGTSERPRQGPRGMDIGPGTEIVTSTDEHPGLIGPLVAARQRSAKSARCRSPSSPTRSGQAPRWSPARTSTGAPARCAQRAGRRRRAVIFDGAQGAGAVPVDVLKLGCAVYAAAGQKWLCGADGTGCSTSTRSSPRRCARSRRPTSRSRTRRSASSRELKADARRYDTPGARARGRRLQPRRVRRPAQRRPRRRAAPAARCSRRSSRSARSPRRRSPRAGTRRSWVRGPGPRGGARPPRAAGVIVRNLPARRTCAPPSAHGRATTTSTGYSPGSRSPSKNRRCVRDARTVDAGAARW